MFEAFATPWTLARHTPLSMEFSRQKYWSGRPLPSPGDHHDPGIEPGLLLCRQPSKPPGRFYWSDVRNNSNKYDIKPNQPEVLLTLIEQILAVHKRYDHSLVQ